MLLKQLQNIQFKAYFIALFIIIAIQIGNWFNAQPAFTNSSNISSIISFLNTNYYLSYNCKAILIIIGALYLQNTVIRHEVIYKNTTLVFLFFLLFNSLIPSLVHVSVYSILSLFLVIIFREIVQLYNNNNPNYILFNAGILIGFGTLLQPAFVLCIIFIVFGFSRFVPFKIKSTLLLLLGLIFPLIIYLSLNYFNPNLFSNISKMDNTLKYTFNKKYDILIIVFVSIVVIWGAVLWAGNISRNTVKSRRIIQTILVSLLNLSLVTFVMIRQNIHALELLSLPFSLCLAYIFSSAKRLRLRNAILILMILFILLAQYHEPLFL